ncbi:amidohydrolase [Salmonella enterica]|uniref:Amidohydrolase n=1 Tax=Salmonella enterica subsp. enterica serovar Panama TaxID=29472 RepID=A0A5U8JFE5_SALET|nr:amidohydrolase [Salmonella enterica]EAA6843828.1 amidohydrolase [Salmonella enterica subsp. enterica serovar Pensacola]EAA8760213.1 amidohydrolase [Salmonella enterica subsp. enterica serovar Rubislaw]EBR7996950.1 amidohydrolase [Salmonella enterica subsp. enterica serovar Panama]EBU7356010.1 amidohydrolase [Salmonella enterica subsp. enterica serovar Poona]EDD5837929.1 amidohydrolase [Salmonella enterica subsp. enterica serovar Enteritidis]
MTTVINKETLVAWRREFHRYPEPGWGEFVTTARIIELLEMMGHQILTGTDIINPEFVCGCNPVVVENAKQAARERGVDDTQLARIGEYTGCAAVFDTGRPGPTVALRFEIDCVCVQETIRPEHVPNKENFSSTNPGYMHACGHDGHTAIGLGVARWLMENKELPLKGIIKLIFQPAEEGVRGARPVAESGILDDVDYFACGHLGCDIPSGVVVVAPERYLSTLKMDLRFKGEAAHAGMAPHAGKNALLAACNATLQIMSLPTHGEGMTRVNVGMLKAGEGRNVIPAFAEMQIEVRGENEKINNYMTEEALRRAHGVAQSFNVELETEVMGEAVDFVPDEEMSALVASVAQDLTGVKEVRPTMNFNGSDDATLLIKRVQAHGGKAAYFIIGSDLKAGHHQAEFDIDENQLWTGFSMFTGLLKHLST